MAWHSKGTCTCIVALPVLGDGTYLRDIYYVVCHIVYAVLFASIPSLEAERFLPKASRLAKGKFPHIIQAPGSPGLSDVNLCSQKDAKERLCGERHSKILDVMSACHSKPQGENKVEDYSPLKASSSVLI